MVGGFPPSYPVAMRRGVVLGKWVYRPSHLPPPSLPPGCRSLSCTIAFLDRRLFTLSSSPSLPLAVVTQMVLWKRLLLWVGCSGKREDKSSVNRKKRKLSQGRGFEQRDADIFLHWNSRDLSFIHNVISSLFMYQAPPQKSWSDTGPFFPFMFVNDNPSKNSTLHTPHHHAPFRRHMVWSN